MSLSKDFLERVQRDYDAESSELDWDAYLAGYIAAIKRFGGRRSDRRETKSKLGYSRIGLNNV